MCFEILSAILRPQKGHCSVCMATVSRKNFGRHQALLHRVDGSAEAAR